MDTAGAAPDGGSRMMMVSRGSGRGGGKKIGGCGCVCGGCG
jgi:hypothetical protein